MANLILFAAAHTAKSAIFDIADCYSGGRIAVRSIDFLSGGSVITNGIGDFTAYATTTNPYSNYYDPSYAFRTDFSKTGAAAGRSWMANNLSANQRLICVFDSEITFDAIIINGFHDYGASVDHSFNNFVVNISSDSITGTTYNAAISNSIEIFDGSISRHITSDVVDDQTLSLSGGTVLPEFSSETSIDTMDMPVHRTLTFNDISSETEITDMTFVNHVDIDMTLPILIADIEGSLTRNDIEMELPALTFEAHKGGEAILTLPSLFMSCEGDNSIVGNVSAKLPMLEMKAETGGEVTGSLPMMTMEATGKTNIVGEIVAHLPLLTMNCSGNNGSVNSLKAQFRIFQLEMQGTTGEVGSINMAIPLFDLTMGVLSGYKGDISAILPMLQARMSVIETGDNDFEGILPMLEMAMESGEIEEEALRYVRGKIR